MSENTSDASRARPLRLQAGESPCPPPCWTTNARCLRSSTRSRACATSWRVPSRPAAPRMPTSSSARPDRVSSMPHGRLHRRSSAKIPAAVRAMPACAWLGTRIPTCTISHPKARRAISSRRCETCSTTCCSHPSAPHARCIFSTARSSCGRVRQTRCSKRSKSRLRASRSSCLAPRARPSCPRSSLAANAFRSA